MTDITGFGDLTISADGTDAVIDLTSQGGGTIRLEGFDVNDLDAGDFNFYDSSSGNRRSKASEARGPYQL